jgi:hypothetical protein
VLEENFYPLGLDITCPQLSSAPNKPLTIKIAIGMDTLSVYEKEPCESARPHGFRLGPISSPSESALLGNAVISMASASLLLHGFSNRFYG